MSMSKRERTLVIIVLILAVLCLYWIFFLKPFSDDMSAVTDDIAKKEEQLISADMNNKTLASLEDKIAQINDEIAEYNQEITQSFDQPPILVYLEKTVTDHAQKVMFTFDNVEQYGEIQVCPVNITMVGTYDGLKKVLKELSEGEHFVKVTSLKAQYAVANEPIEEADDPAETAVDEPAADESEPAAETEPSPAVSEELLDISMSLEFYSMSEAITPDTVYSFDDDTLKYGGDIFY